MSDKFKPGDRVRILVPFPGSLPKGAIATVDDPGDWCGPDESFIDGFYYTDDEIETVDPIREAFDVESYSQIVYPSDLYTDMRIINDKTGGEKNAKPQRFSLLPWDVLGKLAEHYAKGAVKYSDHNWRKGYDWSLAIDALGRHLAAFIEGEDVDPETGSHHMLAVMFHAASLVYFTEAFPELDNRRTKDSNADAHG